MKICRLVCFLFLTFVLLTGSGCAAFRALFSRKGHERREQRREALMIKKSRSAERSTPDRDPVMDMFRIKNKPGYMHDKDLSSRERELLRREMDSSDSDALVRGIRSGYKTDQKKRHDWVFSR